MMQKLRPRVQCCSCKNAKKSLKDIVQPEMREDERGPRLGRQSKIFEEYLKGPKPLKCKNRFHRLGAKKWDGCFDVTHPTKNH